LDAERSRSEAEAANHAKDEFIAAVSHELRTPLNAIMGWVHLLRQATISPETQRHGLEVIDRNATMLARQLADLLEVSAILAGKLKLELHPVDLSSLVESSLDTLRPAAIAKNITLTSDVAPVRPILGEPARLQQILWNLLSNAVKFTPPRGSVHVVLQIAGRHGDG
jgi:signal transduction histidine kinase